MKEFLCPQVKKALRLFEAAGEEAYLVGGCVRDSLMGIPPHDWDIAAAALPEKTIEIFSGYPVIPTGLRHGTVTVVLEDLPIEITTYRVDGAYDGHRRPRQVFFTRSLEEDLARRDFTVNAMAYHPGTGVVDPFRGRQDLQAGVLRCVGNPARRFEEDALRILRAVRFAAVLGFTVEPQTASAMHGRAEFLRSVSAERIWSELRRAFAGEFFAGIAAEFSDIFLPLLGIEPNREKVERMIPVLKRSRCSTCLRLALLLRGLSPDGKTEETCRTALRELKCDKRTAHEVLFLATEGDFSLPGSRTELKLLLSRYGEERLDALLALRQAEQPGEAVERCEAEFNAVLQNGECYSLARLAVNGSDLIAAGYPPGAELRCILDFLLEQVVRDNMPNEKSRLLETANQHFPRGKH